MMAEGLVHSALWAVLFGAVASIATFAGGYLALRVQGLRTFLPAIAAGMVVGISLGDLLPEAIELNQTGPRALGTWLVAGFSLYLLLGAAGASGETVIARWRGHTAPGLLTFHSLLDGVGIGLGWQVGAGVGSALTVAVLAHDIADGVNIVGLSQVRHSRVVVIRWLVANASAPMIGALIGSVLPLSDFLTAPFLGLYAGMFLFIGASDLVPAVTRADPGVRRRVLVAAGSGVMLILASLA